MVEKLRKEGRYGFLFANGGFATDNHCIVLGSEPQEIVDIEKLKTKVHDYAPKLQEDKDMNGNFDELAAALKAEVTTIDEVKQKAIEKAAKAEAEKKRQAEEAAKAAEAENAPAAPAEEKK